MLQKKSSRVMDSERRSDGATVAGGWARLSDEDFVRMLFTEGDQLPLEFAREAVSRGARILPRLAGAASEHCVWHRSDAGLWAPVHAVLLLGAIGGAAAIDPLIAALHLAEEFENEWVIEALPSIFGGLGPDALGPLRSIALDPEEDWMTRHTAMGCMAGVALRHPEQDAEIFQFIGRVAGDEAEENDVRAWASLVLLHFSRREHKSLLLKLVDSGVAEGLYGKLDVRKGMSMPRVVRYGHDWLEFYRPEQIAERRRRWERGRLPVSAAWREALSREWGADPAIGNDLFGNPYDGPDDWEYAPEHVLDRLFDAEPKTKVGRNDPCLCGSGKKFKKCCLDRPVGHA